MRGNDASAPDAPGVANLSCVPSGDDPPPKTMLGGVRPRGEPERFPGDDIVRFQENARTRAGSCPGAEGRLVVTTGRGRMNYVLLAYAGRSARFGLSWLL